MAKKKKKGKGNTPGALLVAHRWNKTTQEQRDAIGRKLTDARLAKRQPKTADDQVSPSTTVSDDDGAPD